MSQISQLLREPEPSNFVNTLEVAKYIIVETETKMLNFNFTFNSISQMQHREICVEDLLGF